MLLHDSFCDIVTSDDNSSDTSECCGSDGGAAGEGGGATTTTIDTTTTATPPSSSSPDELSPAVFSTLAPPPSPAFAPPLFLGPAHGNCNCGAAANLQYKQLYSYDDTAHHNGGLHAPISSAQLQQHLLRLEQQDYHQYLQNQHDDEVLRQHHLRQNSSLASSSSHISSNSDGSSSKSSKSHQHFTFNNPFSLPSNNSKCGGKNSKQGKSLLVGKSGRNNVGNFKDGSKSPNCGRINKSSNGSNKSSSIGRSNSSHSSSSRNNHKLSNSVISGSQQLLAAPTTRTTKTRKWHNIHNGSSSSANSTSFSLLNPLLNPHLLLPGYLGGGTGVQGGCGSPPAGGTPRGPTGAGGTANGNGGDLPQGSHSAQASPTNTLKQVRPRARSADETVSGKKVNTLINIFAN